ncbi:hypothetical protein BRPE64_BCDS01890 [Caballeronia insecticola]|uniref:Uncharacterized protein n=1 Tax=Caballeronia insecticola TaxID=758793 RepID=R4WV16_9BURK|nr:hypothetical protein BRPE64_BCDS01890 [Caballeronia insecticola]
MRWINHRSRRPKGECSCGSNSCSIVSILHGAKVMYSSRRLMRVTFSSR